MKKLKVLVALSLVALLATPALAADTIKIGYNIPMTGDIPKVGEMSKQSAEMLKEDINGAGGLEVGGKKYMLEFIYEDNEAKAESAVTTALKLIEKDEILAMIGPNSSKQAVPAGQVANDNETVMVTPWSTNPDTTFDRPWVFRAAFWTPSRVRLPSTTQLKPLTPKPLPSSTTSPTTIPKVGRKSSRASLKRNGGANTVLAFESHGTKDQDFSCSTDHDHRHQARLHLLVPDNYNQVALIVPQARKLGYKGEFMGSDSWGLRRADDRRAATPAKASPSPLTTQPLVQLAPPRNSSIASPPSTAPHLTTSPHDLDATRVVLLAIQNAGELTGNVKKTARPFAKAWLPSPASRASPAQ